MEKFDKTLFYSLKQEIEQKTDCERWHELYNEFSSKMI